MAYSKEMKKINLALTPDDFTKFQGVKSFLKLKTDADVIRACITDTYFNLCLDMSKVEAIKDALDSCEKLKHELLKLLFDKKKECNV